MRQPGSRELYAYWDRLRGSRAAPERADLDPAAIPTLLADTFILAVDPNRDFSFCLSSLRLNALFETQLNGRSFLSIWNQNQRFEIASLLQTLMDGAVPIVGGAEASPSHYEKTAFEFLLLPLRHNGKTHARLLGRLAPACHPPWFGLSPVKALDFKSMRVLDARDAIQPTFSSDVEHDPEMPFRQRRHLRMYSGKSRKTAPGKVSLSAFPHDDDHDSDG